VMVALFFFFFFQVLFSEIFVVMGLI
jgi:hypothetical protein